MHPTAVQIIGTVLFFIALIHTFSHKFFIKLAHRYPEGSVRENLFHLLSEVEIVFGLWAGVLFALIAITSSYKEAIFYVESSNFTEPLFVFAILVVASTKPVLQIAQLIIGGIANKLPFNRATSFFASALIIGPLLGSFITEPAAMTVTAMLLYDHFFKERSLSERFLYITMATLFVNVSIGGVITPYAAPPVLMVASVWNWDLSHMFNHFGFKAILAVGTNTALAIFLLRNELASLKDSHDVEKDHPTEMRVPGWVMVTHLLFLGFIVFNAHHPAIFMGALLFFIGFTVATKEFQEVLKIKEGLLVAFFLAGLVVIGKSQQWWLQSLISQLGELQLYFGATALTAITDNAALTFLGSLVEGLSSEAKYFLVAGAITGGGLTVIANAPNPAGYGILKPAFPQGVSALKLFLWALPPTAVSATFFILFPSF